MARDRRNERICLKEHIVERWVARRLGAIDHERRVTAIAATLFDLTADIHQMGVAQRRLLRLAGIVHDVGRSVDGKSHPTVGADMIVRDSTLPLTAAERRCLAYLTRYHRGAVPQNGYAEHLTAADDRKAMLRLLALLRAADALDSRSALVPRLVLAMRGKRIAVTCYLDKDCPRARRIYRRRKKHRLLEDTLGCRIDVEVQLAEAVCAVA
jgi:exopolyphosphatase / guanosine-5'-triphosphate,3'-diphosphate pyrophosphatase